MSYDKRTIERNVATLTNWMQEVGGFNSLIWLAISIFLPFFQQWQAKKHLIHKVYRRELPQQKSDDLETKEKSLRDKAVLSLGSREKVMPTIHAYFACYILKVIVPINIMRYVRRPGFSWIT